MVRTEKEESNKPNNNRPEISVLSHLLFAIVLIKTLKRSKQNRNLQYWETGKC